MIEQIQKEYNKYVEDNKGRKLKLGEYYNHYISLLLKYNFEEVEKGFYFSPNEGKWYKLTGSVAFSQYKLVEVKPVQVTITKWEEV